jgi:hypothetical protein
MRQIMVSRPSVPAAIAWRGSVAFEAAVVEEIVEFQGAAVGETEDETMAMMNRAMAPDPGPAVPSSFVKPPERLTRFGGGTVEHGPVSSECYQHYRTRCPCLDGDFPGAVGN